MSKVGVVIPSYNEHECIASLVSEIRATVPESLIVIVDDSPNEKTAEALREYLNEKTHIIRRKAKGGRGTAVIEGLSFLVGNDVDVALEMDADFSHPPRQIPELVKTLQERNLDLLIASRYLPESRIENWPLSRRIFSFLSNKLTRVTLGIPVCDYTNGFRCYSRPAAEIVAQTCGKLGSGFISLSEILVNLYYRGYTVGEVPTRFVNRVRGESSLNSKEITNALRGLIRIRQLRVQLAKNKGSDISLAGQNMDAPMNRK